MKGKRVEVTTTLEGGFDYKIAVKVDGKLERVVKTPAHKILHDRNAIMDYWGNQGDEVAEVKANPIPPILTMKGGVR